MTAADIAAVLPDISVEDNQKLAQAAQQLAGGLGQVAQLVGSGPAYKRMALRMFVKFAGEQIGEQEIEQMIKDGVTDGQSEEQRPGGDESARGSQRVDRPVGE